MRRLPIALALAALASGCIAPHSVAFGTTARPLGPGVAEMSLSPGLAYQSVTSAPTPPGGTTVTTSNSRAFAMPLAEGNIEYGVADDIGANLHLSTAGVQPGAKFSFRGATTDYALLPSIALGYAAQGAGTTTTGPGVSTDVDLGGNALYGFQMGVRFIASHESGFYGGLSLEYQRIANDKLLPAAPTPPTPQGTLVSSFNFGAGAGFELSAGLFKLRPEVSFLFVPIVNNWVIVGTTSAYAPGGSQIVFFPNLTIALATGSRPPPAQQPVPTEGMKEEELSLPPVFTNP